MLVTLPLQILAILCFTLRGVLSSPALFAQDQASKEWKYKGEVFGSVGLGRFYHGDHHLGSGLEYGGGLGIRPFSRGLRGLGFEILFNGLNFRRAWGGGYSYDGKMQTVGGDALYHFGRSRTQLYLVGGVGLLNADYTYVAPNDPNYVEKSKGSKMAINFGAGIKARIALRLSVRPELRLIDTTIGKGYNWSYIRFSVALGYHF